MFSMVPYGRKNRHLFESSFPGFDRFFDVFDKGMSTDIVDKGDHYELRCDLPGLSKEDIKVSIENDLLRIIVDRKDERKEEKDDYLLQERQCFNYSRQFDISGIRKDEISGSYKNGVLHLNLPKEEKTDTGKDYLEIEFED